MEEARDGDRCHCHHGAHPACFLGLLPAVAAWDDYGSLYASDIYYWQCSFFIKLFFSSFLSFFMFCYSPLLEFKKWLIYEVC